MGKHNFLPALALAGGAAGFGLRFWQQKSAFDPEAKLFRSGALATVVLIAALVVLAVVIFVLVQGARRPADYIHAFYCPSAGYMTLMTAGSFLLLGAAGLGVLEVKEQLTLWRMGYGVSMPLMLAVTVVLCFPAALAGLMLGKGNYRGYLPVAHPLLATLPVYVVLPWIVALYQEESRQPETMLYVFGLLAVICTVLGLYWAAAMAFGSVCVKGCLFFSLMGIVLLLTSLADRPSRFNAVMSLACVLLLTAQSVALSCNAFGPAWLTAPVMPGIAGKRLQRAEEE